MASLSQATAATRSFLRWAGILLAIFLIVRYIMFPLGQAVYHRLFPVKPSAPTVSFSKLPGISFPANLQQPQTMSILLQTTSGTLPPTCLFDQCVVNADPRNPANIPDRLNVYKSLGDSAGFYSYARAKQKAGAIGFTGEGTALSDIVYQWRHPTIEDRQVTINIVTNSLSLTTKIASRSPESPKHSPPLKDAALTHTKNFLSSMGLLPADIDDASSIVTLLKNTNDKFSKATSLSEADLTEVNLYRKPLSNLPIIYPNSAQSLMTFLLQSDNYPEGPVLQASYNYTKFDDKNPATYPIKTAQMAFDELQTGKAYIASSPITGNRQVGITKIYVAYYEDINLSEYLEPVFVFEDDGDFQALVPAITDEWLE